MFKKFKHELLEGKNLLVFSGLNTIGHGLAMLIPLFVAKLLEPSAFASFSLARMVLFLFVGLLFATSDKVFIVNSSQELSQSGKFSKTFTSRLIFTAVGIVLFLAVVSVFSRPIKWFAAIGNGELIIVSLCFLGAVIKDFTISYLLILNKRIVSGFLVFAYGILSILLIVLLYLKGLVSVKTALMIDFFASIVCVLLIVKSVDFSKALPLIADKINLKKMLDFSLWGVFGFAGAYLVNWGDNFVLKFYYVPMEQIGIYNLGYQFFKGFTILIFSVGTYFLPFISQNIANNEKIRVYLNNKRPKIFAASVFLMCIFFIVSPYIERFFGSGYYGMSDVLRILLVGSFFAVYSSFYQPLLYAMQKYKFLQIVNIVQVVLNIALDFILVPIYGITGAAIATTTAYLISTVIYEVHFQTKLKRAVI